LADDDAPTGGDRLQDRRGEIEHRSCAGKRRPVLVATVEDVKELPQLPEPETGRRDAKLER
jgi:hypothetical protein